MKKHFLGLIGAGLLAGCSAAIPGTGSLTDGSSVVGQMNVDATTGKTSVMIISPQGWQCSGTFPDHKADTSLVSAAVPLTCSNGAHGIGQAVMTTVGYRNMVQMAFHLSNGKDGNATFPFGR